MRSVWVPGDGADTEFRQGVGMFKKLKDLMSGEERQGMTPKGELVKQLDLLMELRQQRESLSKSFNERIAVIVEEEARELGDLPDRIDAVEKRCKELGLFVGESVFGSELKAEFAKGRMTADVKGLQGYAHEYPGVMAFLRTGKPSVRIKAITKKEREALTLEARMKDVRLSTKQ